MKIIKKMTVLGVPVSRATYTSTADAIIFGAREGKSMGVAALSVYGLTEAYLNRELKNQIKSLHIITPDGQPIRWVMNLLGAKELNDRVAGPDLMLKVCEKSSAEKMPIFFYGSKESVLNSLSYNLIKKFPDLIIAGIQSDRFRDATVEEDRADIKLINDSKARIVFIARGCPRQEKWVAQHIGKINAVMVAVGAAFDFHAGTVKRAPLWMQRVGLEWLFRLLREPKRLWRRYLFSNTLFVYLLVRGFVGLSIRKPIRLHKK
jgi:exopolysaccharide biosynthesis WecB/TagA/CpsF family protein